MVSVPFRQLAGYWQVVTALAGLLLLQATPVSAQKPLDVVATERALGRIELDLLKMNLIYLSRSSNAESRADLEKSRESLVSNSRNAVARLAKLAEQPGQYAEVADAQRLASRLAALQTGEYQRVNDLFEYRNNSLVARRAYYDANAAARTRTTGVLDSLEAARNSLAVANSLRNEVSKMTDLWLYGTQRINALYHDYTQVYLSYLRVHQAMDPIFEALSARDGAGFEKLRRQAVAEARIALNELATGHDELGLDNSFREAGRDYTTRMRSEFTGALLPIGERLNRLSQLSQPELDELNRLFREFIERANAANEEFNDVGKSFLKRNSPDMTGSHPR
ncbi:hypothetical protein GCM10022409_04420 [Hymenobacter glaciei]|uniref:Uncharacterized protein n=1 Tax=Hymenobacter glaciei TaxID=877209 RepID=A0ABP7TB60_9BACT